MAVPNEFSFSVLHVQAQYCISDPYSIFPKCISCEEEDPEGCRFLFFRLFSTTSEGCAFEVKGFIKLAHASLYNQTIYRYFLAREEYNKHHADNTSLIEKKSISNEPQVNHAKAGEDALYVLSQIREPVLKILTEAQEFLTKHKEQMHQRKPLAPFCQMCDACNIGIFSVYWFCKACGIEVCLDCFSTQKHTFLDMCIQSKKHSSADFIPMTNYSRERISKFHASVKAFQPIGFKANAFTIEDYLFTPLKSLAYPYIKSEELNDEIFRLCWSKGIPVVVKASLTADASHVTPQYFIKKYGHAETDILKLSGAPIGATDFAAFFKDFSTTKHFNSNLKIKDFPQTQKFADVLPCLYSDFLDQLPLQKYMRYDGPLNLVSLLPTHTHIVPDLGPKMYAAYAGKTAARTGTTQLHLDPADAINIMQFMAGPSGEAGALWHVFHHSDVDTIRRFLKANLKKTPVGDPIHDQAFYLTDTLLEKLYKEEGVLPFLIKQKVGEVIIIPAGCPHQVRNLYPCIKIALGFVTPESAHICVKLANEFCMLPQGHTRNSDILNIPTLLTQAWGTCMKRLGKVIFSEDDIFVSPTSEKRDCTKTDPLANSHSKHTRI